MSVATRIVIALYRRLVFLYPPSVRRACGRWMVEDARRLARDLTLRSAHNLAQRPLGFQPDGVYKAEVNLRNRSYPEATQRVDFYSRLVRGAEGLPDVASAGLAMRVPFTWSFGGSPVEAEGAQRAGQPAGASGQIVGPGYFATMAIPVIRGRVFGSQDEEGAPLTVVLGEGLARRLWPGVDPLGRRMRDVPEPRVMPRVMPSPDHGARWWGWSETCEKTPEASRHPTTTFPTRSSPRRPCRWSTASATAGRPLTWRPWWPNWIRRWR